MTRHRVARLSEIGRSELKRVEVNGIAICLVRLEEGDVYAIDDTCTHEFFSLSEGELYNGAVQCPMHGSLFDARTGSVTGLPAVEPVSTYSVVVEDDEIFVDIQRSGVDPVG